MNLLQAIVYRATRPGYPIGPLEQPRCQGRCCGHRTAPVFVTFGSHGMRVLCADCRAWHERLIRARIRDLRRAA